MKERIAALTSLILFITTIFFVANILNKKESIVTPVKGSAKYLNSSTGGFPQYDQKNQPVWDRENSFINDNLYKYQGYGPELLTTDQKNGYTNINGIKILIFGDSFTWGNGATDPDMVIGVRLQDELDKLAGEGAFQVLVYGRNGDSTFNYVDLYNKKVFAKVKPDLILYDYFANDPIPSFDESMICGPTRTCEQNTPASMPIYKNCIKGSNSIYGRIVSKVGPKIGSGLERELLLRNCDPLYQSLKKSHFDPGQIMQFPKLNPWWPLWKVAVTRLTKQLSGYPLFVADLTNPNGTSQELMNETYSVFKANNWVTLPMENSMALVKKYKLIHDESSLSMNPNNGHAASMLTASYAKDIAPYIINHFAKSKVRNALLYYQPLKRNLVSYYLPFDNLKVLQNTPDQATLKFAIDPNFKEYTMQIGGTPVPFQYVSCAALGYGYITIDINRKLSSGTKLFISSIRGANNFLLTTDFYDENFKNNPQTVGKIGSGIEITLPKDFHGGAILIGDPNQSKYCPLEKKIKLNPFEVSIRTGASI